MWISIYSLISLYHCNYLNIVGILVMMWRNLSCNSLSATDGSISPERSKKDSTVDCSGANRGLFLGVLALVAVIISMIVYFILIPNHQFVELAVIISYTAELVLYILALTAVCMAAYLMWDLHFVVSLDITLDGILQLIGLVGVTLYSAFSIIAVRYSYSAHAPALIVTAHILLLIETVAQTLFITNGLQRRARLAQHALRRPGRQPVTFLLICNVAMWGLATFEMLRAQTNPIGELFFGYSSWGIVAHISLPLATFYRFHSTVCLADIWQNAYAYCNS